MSMCYRLLGFVDILDSKQSEEIISFTVVYYFLETILR